MDKTLQSKQVVNEKLDKLAHLLEEGIWVTGENPQWFILNGEKAIAVPAVFMPHPLIRVWRNLNE